MAEPTRAAAVLPAVVAMGAIVVASNILVQFPFTPFGLADYLTWGAFTYPFAFLVTDLSNRRFGPRRTRHVVYAGFAVAVVLSIVLATPRIAVASGSAFLAAQLLDVQIFDRLRRKSWWVPPLASSLIGSALDTGLFFTLAFAGDPTLPTVAYPLLPATVLLPVWAGWAVCDFLVKVTLALILLGPYRAAMRLILPLPAEAVATAAPGPAR